MDHFWNAVATNLGGQCEIFLHRLPCIFLPGARAPDRRRDRDVVYGDRAFPRPRCQGYLCPVPRKGASDVGRDRLRRQLGGGRSGPLLLSRSPANGRWIGLSFVVEVGDSVRDGAFESVGIGEGTIGQIMLLEVAPASLDSLPRT